MKVPSAAPSPVFHSIETAFSRCGWKSRRVPGEEVLECDFDLYHTRVRLHAQAFPAVNAVCVVTTLGHQIPDSRMGLVSETLMRTNRDLTVGAFELDYDRGAVLFRATNLFPPGPASPDIIAGLAQSALAETDRLTPFLTLLLRMTPEELGKLNLPLFLQREDLLPPLPDDADAAVP